MGGRPNHLTSNQRYPTEQPIAKLKGLLLCVCLRILECLCPMPSSTNERFTVLSIEAARQQPLETVSNSLADTVLIKTGSGNGDLESSQWRIGCPGATGTVSVVARYLCFLTEIFVLAVADAEKAQNAQVETKNVGRRSLVVQRSLFGVSSVEKPLRNNTPRAQNS